ncbi:gamma-aminobutyric acid receptor alpha-like [Amphibalanus amphitrite]|uniref:gamma-aminobutyric acid receptor alpha-like n=1 Tax=Amphibalanus amphitrite TaxID=1232801 RepID=UPI001C91B927|nr:gamma-aminobutyric acid receptor alpha-like [Amphibalanus amphitrite]
MTAALQPLQALVMQLLLLLLTGPASHLADGYRFLSSELNGTKPSEATSGRIQRRHANLALSENISAVLENLLKNYDSTQRPASGLGPTRVQTNILIRSMGPISELDMEYSMDCYFRQMWRDQRLTFNSSIDQLSLSIKMLEGIWKPDTYFLNGRGSYVHTITRPNKLIRLSSNGVILYSMRLTIKAKCPMLLQHFPMDKQTCPLVIGSYAYTSHDVIYEWDHENVRLARGIYLSQFDLISYPFRNATVQRKGEEYSILQVNFNLQRHTGYFMINVYLPCTLIVVLSWVSFWINREATADRVSLGITAVLTLSTISIDSRISLPKVSYATAMDWFLFASFAFVIATLLEFAGVHFFTKVGSGEFPVLDESNTEQERRSQEEEEEEEDEWEDEELMEEELSPEQEQELRPGDVWRHRTGTYIGSRDIHQGMLDNHISVVGGLPSPSSPSPKPVRSDPCWYQVLHCIIGNELYRRKRRSAGSRINSVSRIDRVSRVLFPLLFGCLSLFYWNLYWSQPPPNSWEMTD